MGFDLKLFELINGLAGKSVFWDKIFVFFAVYSGHILILFFLYWLIRDNKISRKEKWFWFWAAFISAGIARSVVTEIIRNFYHSPRPYVVDHAITLISENSYSFPSGHTIFIFALAATAYFYNKKLGYIIGVGGLIMGFARIIAGVHWPSDILGGIVIGILVSFTLFKFFGKKFKSLHFL